MVKQDTLLLCSRIRENRQALRNVFSDAFHLLESGDVRQMTMLLRQNLSCVAAVLLDISSWNPEDTQWLDCGENAIKSIQCILFISYPNIPHCICHTW